MWLFTELKGEDPYSSALGTPSDGGLTFSSLNMVEKSLLMGTVPRARPPSFLRCQYFLP